MSFVREMQSWLNPRAAGGRLALAVAIASVAAGGSRTLGEYLVLRPVELLFGVKLWLPLTSLFVAQPAPLAIVFSVLMCVALGNTLEAQWGARRFWTFVFAVGLGAEVLTSLLALVVPSLLGVPVFGASVLVSALWVAQGLLAGPRQMSFFSIPATGYALAAIGVAFPLLSAVFGDWRHEVAVFIGLGLTAAWLQGWGPERLWHRFRSWQVTRQLSRGKVKLRVVEPEPPRDEKRERDRYLN